MIEEEDQDEWRQSWIKTANIFFVFNCFYANPPLGVEFEKEKAALSWLI